MEKWYALKENERIVEIGEFDGFTEALESTRDSSEFIYYMNGKVLTDWGKKLMSISDNKTDEELDEPFVFAINGNGELVELKGVSFEDSIENASFYWSFKGNTSLSTLYQDIKSHGFAA